MNLWKRFITKKKSNLKYFWKIRLTIRIWKFINVWRCCDVIYISAKYCDCSLLFKLTKNSRYNFIQLLVFFKSQNNVFILSNEYLKLNVAGMYIISNDIFSFLLSFLPFLSKDDFLEILLHDRNQVDHKISWGLGEGFLSIHSSLVC